MFGKKYCYTVVLSIFFFISYTIEKGQSATIDQSIKLLFVRWYVMILSFISSYVYIYICSLLGLRHQHVTRICSMSCHIHKVQANRRKKTLHFRSLFIIDKVRWHNLSRMITTKQCTQFSQTINNFRLSYCCTCQSILSKSVFRNYCFYSLVSFILNLFPLSLLST